MLQSNLKTEAFFKSYQPHSYHDKEVIIDWVDVPLGAYYLAAGQVRQYIISEEGEELTLHVYEVGAFFPMTWVINNTPNRHIYEAIGKVELRIAPADDFKNFLLADPELLLVFVQRLLLGLNGMMLRVESLSLQNARKRVISMLLYLARHFGVQQEQRVVLRSHFTHRNISTYTGLARETTSVEISKLEREGLVRYDGASLVISNIDKLESLLNL